MAKRVCFGKKWQITFFFSSNTITLNIWLKTFYARLNSPFLFIVFCNFNYLKCCRFFSSLKLAFFKSSFALTCQEWANIQLFTKLFEFGRTHIQLFSRSLSFFQEFYWILGVSMSSGHLEWSKDSAVFSCIFKLCLCLKVPSK